jgi:hypothetical protein
MKDVEYFEVHASLDSIELYMRAKCCREREWSEDAWEKGEGEKGLRI